MWASSGIAPRRVLACCHRQQKAPWFIPTISLDAQHRWNHSASSISRKPSWFSRIVAWYDRQLEQRPFLTKGLTAGFVAANGDLLCQFLMHRNNNHSKETTKNKSTDESLDKFRSVWDRRRTLHFFLLGSFWVAPVLHVWYGFLSRTKSVFSAAAGSRRAVMLLLGQRVALDQFVFTPLFAPTFLMGLWGLDGTLSWDKVKRQLPAIMPSMLCANWLIWIPAQAFNFSFVPVPYHVLFSNVVSLFWNAVVSFLEQQKKHLEITATTTTTTTATTTPEMQA